VIQAGGDCTEVKIRGSKLVVKALEAEGVRRVFGIPGTHNIELYDALEDSANIEIILVTHECGASFMADGLARSSGEIGVLALVPGAGVTHALSGIAEAFMDHVPMVILACGIRNDTGAAYQLHAIDQLAVLHPVTRAVLKVERPEDIYPMVRRAFSEASRGAGGPVAVEIPANYLMLVQDVPEPELLEFPLEENPPDPAILERAAALLSQADCPMIYVGRGAREASELVVNLAETLGAPVVTTFQGKGVMPESHPLWLWTGFGAQAPPFVRDISSRCDAMLAVGCRFSEVATGSYGIQPPARLIHVDIESEVFGKNYPAELISGCSARPFLEGLLGLISGRRPANELIDEIAQGRRKLEKEWARQKPKPGKVTPGDFFSALQRHVKPDTVFVTDSGNGTFLAAEHLRLEKPGRFLAPVDFSCMGYSTPAGIGAALGKPGGDVVVLPGDGAFLMTGMELLTAAAYGVGVLVCVLRDEKLTQIAQFQKLPLGRETASVLPDYSLEGIAQAVGAPFYRIVSEAELETILPRVLDLSREGRPVLLELMLDSSEKTYFTRGVLKTNFWRLSWSDRLRMILRALIRRIS